MKHKADDDYRDLFIISLSESGSFSIRLSQKVILSPLESLTDVFVYLKGIRDVDLGGKHVNVFGKI